jgi:hypothetical protein
MNNVSVQYECCSVLWLLFAHEHVVKVMKPVLFQLLTQVPVWSWCPWSNGVPVY